MSLTHGTAVGLPGRVPVDLRPSHAPAATRATRRSEDRDWCRVHFRVKLWEIPNLVMTNSSPWLSHGPNRFIDGLPVYLLIAWWIFPWRTVKNQMVIVIIYILWSFMIQIIPMDPLSEKVRLFTPESRHHTPVTPPFRRYGWIHRDNIIL